MGVNAQIQFDVKAGVKINRTEWTAALKVIGDDSALTVDKNFNEETEYSIFTLERYFPGRGNWSRIKAIIQWLQARPEVINLRYGPDSIELGNLVTDEMISTADKLWESRPLAGPR